MLASSIPLVQTPTSGVPAFVPLPYLPAVEGAPCAWALRRGGCGPGRCGAAMCALDPRGQQHTAGEAAGGKRDPELGLFTGRGVSRAAVWEAQKMLQERSGTLPAPGGTQSRPFLGPGLTSGLPRVYFVHLRLRVVVMGLCHRP